MTAMCPFANFFKQLAPTDFHCGARKQLKSKGILPNRWWISSQVSHIMNLPSYYSTSQTEFDNWVKGLCVSAEV